VYRTLIVESPWILFGVFPAAAYVVGSTPFGVIIARWRGVNLRKVGSGNVGATNVARAAGRRWGYVCFVLDVAKGFVPALAAGVLLGATSGLPSALVQAAWLAVGFAAIAGHVFSFYLKFRGGKGVATSLGVVLGMYPFMTFPGLVALALWLVVTLTSRYVSLGSVAAAVAFLPLFAAFNCARFAALWPLATFIAAMAALILVRHRANIARLLAGTENKIGARRA
jgi:glycerol-3-phosphate acyltransferase PlsY